MALRLVEHHPVHSGPQLRRIDGFGEGDLRAESLGHVELYLARGGNRDDRGPWLEFSEQGDELETVNVRHLKIGDDDLDAAAGELRQGLVTVSGQEDFVPGPLEHRA